MKTQLTFDYIKALPLGRVIELYRQESISTAVAEQYCELWNTCTYRFTYAKVVGQTIMQFNPERYK